MRTVLVMLMAAGICFSQVHPTKMHVKQVGDNFIKYTSKLQHVVELNFTMGFHHRDGKPAYLEDVPRTLSYIVDIAPRYPELEFLIGLIEDRVLPGMRA